MIFSDFWKTKSSYAWMIDPQTLIGKVNARLATRRSIIMRARPSSTAVIVFPKRVSTLK